MSRREKSIFLQFFFQKISYFQFFIAIFWKNHEKCIQRGTNRSNLSSVVLEIATESLSQCGKHVHDFSLFLIPYTTWTLALPLRICQCTSIVTCKKALNRSVASPICQEGQSERTFPIIPLFPSFSCFFPIFSLFSLIFFKFFSQGGTVWTPCGYATGSEDSFILPDNFISILSCVYCILALFFIVCRLKMFFFMYKLRLLFVCRF